MGADVPLDDGDHLRAYGASGRCVGEAVWSGGAGLTLWGDDAMTSEVEGVLVGEAFALRAVRGTEEVPLWLSFSEVLLAPVGTGAEYHPSAIYFVDAVTTQSPTAEEGLPGGFRVSDAHPNPFASSSTLTLELARTQRVAVVVYDVLGRAVERLHGGLLESGRAHRFTVEAAGLATGAYLVRVEGEDFVVVRRLTLLR